MRVTLWKNSSFTLIPVSNFYGKRFDGWKNETIRWLLDAQLVPGRGAGTKNKTHHFVMGSVC